MDSNISENSGDWMFQFELVTILLIEADYTQARSIEKSLQGANITTPLFLVRDGKEALDYLFAEGQYHGQKPASPLLIILDLDLPDHSGLSVLETIKTDERTRNLPVTLLSAAEDMEKEAREKGFGANLFVKKPVTNEKIAKAVAGSGYFFSIIALPAKKE
jgi:two-component system, response regulator